MYNARKAFKSMRGSCHRNTEGDGMLNLGSVEENDNMCCTSYSQKSFSPTACVSREAFDLCTKAWTAFTNNNKIVLIRFFTAIQKYLLVSSPFCTTHSAS